MQHGSVLLEEALTEPWTGTDSLLTFCTAHPHHVLPLPTTGTLPSSWTRRTSAH